MSNKERRMDKLNPKKVVKNKPKNEEKVTNHIVNYGIQQHEEYELFLELEKRYKKKVTKFDWNRFKLDVKTFFLMCLPLGLYIWVLKNKTTTRLTNYAGILGTAPVAYPVHNGVILVDLNRMSV